MLISRIRKSNNIWLIAFLALLFGQAALLVHEVAEDHPDEEYCEICMSLDRPVTSGTSIATVALQSGFAILVLSTATRIILGRHVLVLRSRSPPTT